MIDTPRILRTSLQSTACVHLTVPRSDIRKVMGPGLHELRSALAAQGIVPTGPWLTHHLRMDPGIFDFEISLPVDRPVAAMGRVTPGTLPAVTAARAVHHGPYEGLSASWAELEAWIAAQGYRSGPSLWETYLTDPASSPDQATWRTELTRPLLE